MSEGIDKPPTPPAAEVSEKTEKKPRKRFVGTSARAGPSARGPVRRVANQVPDDIVNDPALKLAMAGTYPYLPLLCIGSCS